MSESLPNGLTLYGYTLQEPVNRTESCIVYRAVHELLQETVLLHEFYPQRVAGRDPESLMVLPIAGKEDAYASAMAAFGAEMRSYASLLHAQVYGVKDALSEEGLTYCVQRAPQGKPLYAALTANAGEGILRPLLAQATAILQYMSDKGVSIRGLNPNALYVNEGSLSINLFGAEALDASNGYTALECVQQGASIGTPAAVYTLGAIFYCMITGQAPQAVSSRIGRTDSYAPLVNQPGLIGPYTRPFLEGIDKALSLWQEDRWQNFASWHDTLVKK